MSSMQMVRSEPRATAVATKAAKRPPCVEYYYFYYYYYYNYYCYCYCYYYYYHHHHHYYYY